MTSTSIGQRSGWTLRTIVGRILGLGEVARPRRKQQTYYADDVDLEELEANMRQDEEVRRGPFSSDDLRSAGARFHPV
jgi:hypothetical protein